MAIPILAVGYAAAAVAFVFLFALLVTSWRGRLQGMLLAVASLVNALWAATLAYAATQPHAATLPAEILEILRDAVWFAFLMVLLGYSGKAVRPLRLSAALLMAYCGGVLVITMYSGMVTLSPPGTAAILSRVVMAVIGMVLVEQLYRNVNSQQRWGIKFLCLGLGGMFARSKSVV